MPISTPGSSCVRRETRTVPCGASARSRATCSLSHRLERLGGDRHVRVAADRELNHGQTVSGGASPRQWVAEASRPP
jgi:hypothetical protein